MNFIKKIIFILTIFIFLLLLFLEITLRQINYLDSPNSKLIKHEKLGWVTAEGEYIIESNEFSYKYKVNSLNMRDVEFNEENLKNKIKILTLGDSHTAATGVSNEDTWVKKLQKKLNTKNKKDFITMNAAVGGYSLSQYLIRFEELKNVLRPNYTIVAFSSATDIYDIAPEGMDGFVFKKGMIRHFHDLDQKNNLIHGVSRLQTNEKKVFNLKEFLDNHSYIYKSFKRSKLASYLAINFFGANMWAGQTLAVTKLDNKNKNLIFRWKLIEEILVELKKQNDEIESTLMLLHIPYIAQIYDDYWDSSFGASKKNIYDRFAASKKLQEISSKIGIKFIDTLPLFINDQKKMGPLYFHFPNDRHLNIEGHDFVSKIIYKELVKNEFSKEK